MVIAKFITGIILAYLLGSIPTSLWVGKYIYQVDIRKLGSGNAGATNTIRVLGLKAGIPVLIFDILKGWCAVYVASFFWEYMGIYPDLLDYQILLAIAAVTGHVLPVYAGFRGGKGMATLVGIGIPLYPHALLIVIAVFIVVFFLWRYVSLASIISSLAFPFVEIFLLGHDKYPSLIVLSVLVAIFVPLTHRGNIIRLFRHEELKLTIRNSQGIKSG